MNEAELTQQLRIAIRMTMHRSLPLKHADRFNHGRPDITVTWAKPTSWWEIKFYDNGPFESPEKQRILCKQLAEQGICYYVIYEQRGVNRRTLIVEPDQLDNWEQAPKVIPGFNHMWVAQFIRNCHMRKP